jgi:hypothetical protein
MPRRRILAEPGTTGMMLRLPPDVKGWVVQQAEFHMTSQNAEVLRAIRDRMSSAAPADRSTGAAG